mgnify:CR=1 FL=1
MPSFAPDTWTLPQRKVLLGVGVLLCAYVAVLLLRNPLTVTDPQPVDPARGLALADRIDPNTASAHELAVLPMVGMRRAQDIIDHRTRAFARDPNLPAFATDDDLLKVRGIGVAMLNTLRPYLIFPDEKPPVPAQ